MAADNLDQAIALAGVPDEPSHSEPVVPEPLDLSPDASTSKSKGKGKGKGKATPTGEDDEGDEDDDLVVFDVASTLSGPSSSIREDTKGQGRTRDRASLESLSFGYRDHLLPLTLSGEGDDSAYMSEYGEVEGAVGATGVDGPGPLRRGRRRGMRKAKLKDERRMGLIDGVALTVGLQIGSGIFSSPGVVTAKTGSVGASLLVWLMSGTLAWTGASSFAELGAAIPLNGGAQAYLNYSFGPLSAYLFAWTAIVALKPGSGAIIAIIFGEYMARVIFHATSSSTDPHEQGLDGIPDWSIKLIACIITVLVSTLNALSARLGTGTQIATTVVKLIALFAVPILAIVQAARHKMPDSSAHAFSSLQALFENSSTSPSNYALALYSGLWAFDGWDQSSYVAGEMKNVDRDLPRVIHISLATVLVFFLAANASYFVVLPTALVKRTNTIALDFGSAIFGKTGGAIFAGLVAFSCFGALNGQFYTSARLVYVAGREHYLPSLFGRLNARTRTPVAAICLQTALVILFILFGSGFASLVNFYGVCSWLFYFATVLGLLVLRVTEPNLERPYRTWLSTPIVFSAVALFLLFMPIFSAPLEALAALGFILAGVPMYFITQREGRTRIPGLSSFLARFQRGGDSGGLAAGSGDAKTRTANGDVFGRRKITREGPDYEDEEEGLEEEAVQMLSRQSHDTPRPSSVEASRDGKHLDQDDDDDDDDHDDTK